MTTLRPTAAVPHPPARDRVGTGRALGRAGRQLVDDLLVDELREGALRLSDLPAGVRAAIRAGFAVVVAVVVLVLLSGTVRTTGTLLDIPFTADASTLVPRAAVPAVLGLFGLAWGFLLGGAVHAHPVLRAVALLVFACTTLAIDIGGRLGTSWVGVPLVGIGAAAILLAAGRWVRRWPTAALLAGTAISVGVHLPITVALADVLQSTASPVPVQALAVQLQLLQLLILPLLAMLGLDFADFAYRSSRLAVGGVAGIVPSSVTRALAGALLGWSAWTAGRQVIAHADASAVVAGYAGAAAIPLLGLVVWWLVGRRRSRPDAEDHMADEAPTVAWQMVAALYGWEILAVAVLLLLNASASVVESTAALRLATRAVDLTGRLDQVAVWWQVVVQVGLVLVATRLARRGRTVVATYVGTLAAVGLWSSATAEGAPLAVLQPLDGAESVWWVVASAVAAATLLVRRLRGRAVGEPQVVAVALVLAVSLMARQIDLLDDPWSTVFVFGGIAAVAFGVLWDALTVGRWANEGSRWMPRPARVLGYLGYVLFGVAIIAWAVLTQDAVLLDDLTGGISARGYDVVGRPLLVALRVLLLTRAFLPPPGPRLPAPPAAPRAGAPRPAG